MMKHVVILGDGMADRPFADFGGKTALEFAKKPTIDYLASKGTLGMVKTVPEGMPPGSDTANLSVFGYDPAIYYSGRSPFEAFSIGVPMAETDISFRCNLVTLEGEGAYENLKIIDHSSEDISTEEATILIHAVNEAFSTEAIHFFPGVSYRHIILWNNGPYNWQLVPPHDILGNRIGDYLPKGEQSTVLEDMMRKSYDLLSNHEINRERISRGLRPANSLWIWGEGKKPLLSSFTEKYGVSGSVISAVDLLKGIGLCAGLASIEVPDATGTLHTNYEGKVTAALNALKNGQDFVYVHIEAPDECSHRFEPENKVKSIEIIDEKVVKPIKDGLDALGYEYKIMILPDHPTPLELRTHTSDPVPFLIYENEKEIDSNFSNYSEKTGLESGLYFPEGHTLMDYFMKPQEKVRKYVSTRGDVRECSASEAILSGIADDGGLYVPSNLPKLTMPLRALMEMDYKHMAFEIMSLYFSDFTDSELKFAIEKAYDKKFDTEKIAPLVMKNGVGILELFHGPTLAFKDMALSILPHLMTISAHKQKQEKEIVILTATSGDTGKAALEGFANVPDTRIIVFFPENGVSEIQKLQMTTQEGSNTHVIGIDGNFDDAQTGVKKMFADKILMEKLNSSGKVFSSANSINIGRLVPQIVYYFYSYKQAVESGYISYGTELNYTVPTGNFGDILAGYYAKKMGLPVGKLICASNENKVLYDFIETGVYDANREFSLTSSPSMDILISSNLERLLYHLADGAAETVSSLMKELKAEGIYRITPEMKIGMDDFLGGFADESLTKESILEMYKETGYVMDTHTAVAYGVYKDLLKKEKITKENIILSTASPYKFSKDVLGAILGESADSAKLSLGESADTEVSVSELLKLVSKYSQTPIPDRIKHLETTMVLHKTVCKTSEMQSVVEAILKV